MKILILGGSGMLGHRLWMHLSKQHETWVTVRGEASVFPDLPQFPKNHVQANVDALLIENVTRSIVTIQPDLLINCIGIIKQSKLATDPLYAISINALLPHRISLICQAVGIRMIHISTDCVFSGMKGDYLESDFSDAEDIYGRTKFLGEVSYQHTITLRTSIIGRELRNGLGLIEWFLRQKSPIRGFKKAIYSGFTTDELSNIILNYVIPHPELSGVYHVSSTPISKHDLLILANREFKRGLTIEPDYDFICDRSLISDRFRSTTGYIPPSWEEMIADMASNADIYKPV